MGNGVGKFQEKLDIAVFAFSFGDPCQDLEHALGAFTARHDARKMIVDGAVGMVEMALERLSENHTVELDEERKAAMVSNLLVVLCGNRDAQPVVNSGSLY